MKMTKKKIQQRNKKSAKKRGKAWMKNLRTGHLEGLLHPTKMRIRRLKKQLRQQDMAKRLGVSASAYQSIEKARRAVPKHLVAKIEKALGHGLFRQKNSRPYAR